MVIVCFHLENEVSAMNESLFCTESCAIMIKCSIVTFVPSMDIERVKVILPMEIKSVCRVIVCVRFNVVIDTVPWHVNWMESMSPRVKGWRPEVHHDRLALVHILNSWIFVCDSSDFMAIKTPGNVIWMPDHLIDMPIIKWVKVLHIVMGFQLLLSISVNGVHREWTIYNRRHNLNVHLVPASRVEVWSIPVREE